MWQPQDKGKEQPIVNTGKLPMKALWLDGVMSSDYELDTLPLLFAGSADFELYYDTLLTKHPSKQKNLNKIKKFNLGARACREENNAKACLQALSKCVHLRRGAFNDGNYQFYAALVHYLLTILYFAASRLANGDGAEAYDLFVLARSEMRAHSSCLRTSDRNLLGCMLNNNWANYWFRRGKANAASQCCCRAYQLWMRATDLSVLVLAFLSPYLIARFASALVLAKKYDEAVKVYAKFLKTFSNEKVNADRRVSGGGESDVINVNITTLSLSDPTCPTEPTECCLRSLSVSLTPIPAEDQPTFLHSTNWSIMKSAKFISFYNAAYSRIALRKYRVAQEMLERSAGIFNECYEQTLILGNPQWWANLQKAYNYVCLMEMGEEKTADDYRMKFDEYREREMLYYNRVVNSEVERLKMLKKAKKQGESSMPPKPAAESFVDADETDEDLKMEGEMWQMVLPALQNAKYGSNPRDALKMLKNKRAMSALDYQSIRNLAGNVVKGKTLKKLRKRWSEMDELRKTVTPPPPETTSKSLMFPDRDGDEERSEAKYVLQKPAPREKNDEDWRVRKQRDLAELHKELALARQQPQMIGGVMMRLPDPGPPHTPLRDSKSLSPASLARVSPVSASHVKFTDQPELTADEIEDMRPEDLLESCVNEYLYLEATRSPDEEAPGVTTSEGGPAAASAPSDIAKFYASKVSNLDVTGLSEAEILQAQIRLLQEEFDARQTAESRTRLNTSMIDREGALQEQFAVVSPTSDAAESEHAAPAAAPADVQEQGPSAVVSAGEQDAESQQPPTSQQLELLQAIAPSRPQSGFDSIHIEGASQSSALSQELEEEVANNPFLMNALATVPAKSPRAGAPLSARGGSETRVDSAAAAADAAATLSEALQEAPRKGNPDSAQEDGAQDNDDDDAKSVRSVGSDISRRSSVSSVRSLASDHSGKSVRSGKSGSEAGSVHSNLSQELSLLDPEAGQGPQEGVRQEEEEEDEQEFLGLKQSAYFSPWAKKKKGNLNAKEEERRLLRKKPLIDEPDLVKQRLKLGGLLQYLDPSSTQYQMVVKEIQINDLRQRAVRRAERRRLQKLEEGTEQPIGRPEEGSGGLPPPPPVPTATTAKATTSPKHASGSPRKGYRSPRSKKAIQPLAPAPGHVELASAGGSVILSLASALAYAPAASKTGFKDRFPSRHTADDTNSMQVLEKIGGLNSYPGLDPARQKRPGVEGLQAMDTDPLFIPQPFHSAPVAESSVKLNTMQTL